MDWHTWLLGMHYVNGKPYLYAIMQFFWEPWASTQKDKSFNEATKGRKGRQPVDR
jgi:hypothetical protein